MRSIAPRTGAPESTVAEEQEEYMPITIAHYRYADGSHGILTRWTLTAEERAKIAAGEDFYVLQLTNGLHMTPMVASCGAPEHHIVPEDPG